MDVIKVKANSRTAAVAGAIAGVMREHKHADVQAIGAGAVNQAVKALVLAKGYLAEDGMKIMCLPEFVDVEIEEKFAPPSNSWWTFCRNKPVFAVHVLDPISGALLVSGLGALCFFAGKDNFFFTR